MAMLYQSKVMLFGSSCSSLNICKITEPRKRKLKVEILHDLKNFKKNVLILIVFCNR